MDSRTSNGVKNILSGVGIKLFLLILQFASKTLFVKYLDAYLGINSLLSSALSYLNITELGIGTAINFAMYKPIADNDTEKISQYIKYYKEIYHILGLITIALGVLIAFIMPYLFDINELSFGYREIYIIYVLYVVNACFGYFVFPARGGFLAACQKEYKLTVINFVGSIVSILLQLVAMMLCGKSFLSFVLYTAIPIIVSVIQRFWSGICIEKWYPQIKLKPSGILSREEKKNLYKNTFGLAIEKICVIMNNSVDSIIISALIGITILGKYSLYYTIISLVGGFTSAMFSSLAPSIGNLNSVGSTNQKKSVFNELYCISVWVYGFCAISYCVIIQPFMVVWAGEDKLLNCVVPITIGLNFLLGGMTSAVTGFRNGCGLYYRGRYRPIVYTILNVIFSLSIGRFLSMQFGEVWGIVGIVSATIISRMAITWWFDAYIVFKDIFMENCKTYLIRYLLDFLAIVVAGTIVYVLCLCLSGLNPWIQILLMCIICVLLVNGLMWIILHRSPGFKSAKNRVYTVITHIFRSK